MKQKVTVFGSFVVDLMARTPHLPAPAETVKGSFFKQGAGGKGFNQGVAAHQACLLYTSDAADDRAEIIPAFHVNAVDTTGAGDAFNGGLLAALAEGKDIWEAARFASGLAALSVQRIGTTPAMPTREEIDAFLAEH